MKLSIEGLLRIIRLVILGFLCYNMNKLGYRLSLFSNKGENTMNFLKSFKTRKVFGVEDVISYNRDKQIEFYNLEDYEPPEHLEDMEFVDTFKFKSLFGIYYVMVTDDKVVVWADFVDTHKYIRRSSERDVSTETSSEPQAVQESGGDDEVIDSGSVPPVSSGKKEKARVKRTKAKAAIKKLGPEAAAAGLRLEAVHDSEEDEPEEEEGAEEE